MDPLLSKHRTTLLKFFVQEAVDGDGRVPLLIDNDTIAQCLYDLDDMNHIYESLGPTDQEILDNPLHSTPTFMRWRADRQAHVLKQEIAPKGLPTASKRM